MSEDKPWTTDPQDERDLVLDGPALRALAHPVRVRIVGLLRRQGPSTASRLAEELGLNSGATSYHLRQLADAGLILEADELGNKRDRWWKAAHRSTYYDKTSYDSDPEAAAVYVTAIASAYAERTMEFANRFTELADHWEDAATMSDFRLRLTPQEATALNEELARVIESYRRDDEVEDGTVAAPDGAEVVVVQLEVMPDPTEAER